MSRVSLFEDDYDLTVPGIARDSVGSRASSVDAVGEAAAIQAYDRLRPFLSSYQLSILADCMRGEEQQFFFGTLADLVSLVDGMPVTYAQDGKGDDTIAYLHYFLGDCHWYITEKDMDGEVEQTFGYAILHGDLVCAEYGYISISELVGKGVEAELDFYFAPTPMGEIKEQLKARYG